MNLPLVDDTSKDIVMYVHNFLPHSVLAIAKLSERIGRPLRGVMLVDAERKASGKYLPDKEGHFEEIVVDFSDSGALRKAIKAIEDRLLVVDCSTEGGQLYFKQVIPYVPYVNTPTESSIDYCADKGKMRELLRSFDESISPKAIVIYEATEANIERACAELAFPLIVKPSSLDSSVLVNKVHDKDELHEVLKTSFATLDKIYSRFRGLGDKKMVVEEFIEGDLYSTDAYVDAAGKVYVLPFVHFQNGTQVGMDGYQVYRSETYLTLSDQEMKKGIEAAEKAIHAVGLRSSVAHIELFHTVNGWKIVELGSRPGGWRHDTYALSYGIDHTYNILAIKAGLEPEMPGSLIMHTATFRIHAPKPGVVVAITGIDEARAHPNMHTMEIDVKLGDTVSPATQGGNVLVGGLMFNTDLDQLNRDIDQMRSSIEIVIKENDMDTRNE